MNQFKTLILLGTLSGLMVGLGAVITGDSSGALIGLVMAGVMNISSWFFSDKIALASYQAQPLTPAQAPDLYAMVENLVAKANMPMPGLYMIPSQALNAFATGRDPKHSAVAVTEGIVNMLSAEELEGVIAHELTHIKNRDTLTQTIAATIAGAISYLAQMANFAMLSGRGRGSNQENRPNPIALLLTATLAPMAATVIQLAISRTREFSADAGAAQMTGNPRALANALQRLEMTARQMPLVGNPAFSPLLIVNNFSGQFMSKLFSTHPPTQDRIEKLLRIEEKMGG